jgi:hypothetical protein
MGRQSRREQARRPAKSLKSVPLSRKKHSGDPRFALPQVFFRDFSDTDIEIGTIIN